MPYVLNPDTVSNAENGFIQINFGPHKAQAAPAAFVLYNKGFAGEFNLSTPFGVFWNDFVQTQATTVSVSGLSKIGGCDRVKVTMGGFAFTLPADWVNIGVDAIDTTAAKINIIYAVKTPTGVDYSIKLI